MDEQHLILVVEDDEATHVVGHFQDRPGFANRYQGDLVVHVADSSHFEWVPSHNGVTSLAILTRSWTRTAPVSTFVDLCAPSNCTALDVQVVRSLDPGQTTLKTDSGCGARGASSANAFRPGCLMDAVLSATSALGTPLDAATTKTVQDALRSVEILPTVTPEQHGLIAGLIDDVARRVHPLGGRDAQTVRGHPAAAPDRAGGRRWSTADRLGARPPGSPDQGTVAAAISRAAGLAPDASAVIGSIQSRRPSAADAKAYVAAVKLATAAGYSPGRAAARLELVLAEAFGGQKLARELAHKPPARIAAAKVAIPAGARRVRSLKATRLGARLLRFLGVRGLSRHNTTVRLRITSTRNGSKRKITRLLTVR